MVGPGSTSSSVDERDQWINDSLDVQALDPFGLWFHSDIVKKAARDTVVGNYDSFTPSYKKATSEQKEAWWNRFKAQFKYQKFREPEVKDAFEAHCKEMMRCLISRVGKGDKTWMPDSLMPDLLSYRDSAGYKKRQAQCKKNRASKGKNGKAPGTHTMGRLNAIQFVDKLCNGKEGIRLPPPLELMKLTKTRKAGGYVNDEVSEILETFQKNKDALLETIDAEDIDDREIYMDTVKGFNKKGEVLGLGKATNYYYEKPLPSATPKSKTSYTPGFASKLSAELDSFQKWKLELEKTLAAKGIHITPELCNPNSHPRNNSRADNDDNEGNGGSGSDFATQILSS